MARENFNDKLWSNIVTVFLIIMALFSLYPLLFIVAESFSSNNALERGLVVLWPVDFNFESWIKVAGDIQILRPIFITMIVTVVGTIVCMLTTILLAYPTSKKTFKLTKVISIAVLLTMILKAPMIPYFLTLRSYGLINNPLVLILPHMVIAYNYFVLRTFFQQTPLSLEESALIDGANYYQILFRIIIPVSKAAMATIALFYAVLCWNQFYHPKLFLMDNKYITIQIYLRQILDRASSLDSQNLRTNPDAKYGTKSLNAAAIMFLTLPILCVDYFVQKHFVEVATLGAVKG